MHTLAIRNLSESRDPPALLLNCAQAATLLQAVLNVDADDAGFDYLLCRQFQLRQSFAVAGS
jgi:hypothetical protein